MTSTLTSRKLLSPNDGRIHNFPSRLLFDDIDAPKVTHYLFRFPAKFHPPVAHCLVRRYTTLGQTILDPFCGSGTLLLAAALEGRNAIGCDVDPVSVFVSTVKSRRIEPRLLRHSWSLIKPRLEILIRSESEYVKFQFDDISPDQYEALLSTKKLWVPQIPNLFHWFRRYVIIDLAHLKAEITSTEIPLDHKEFFLLIFASIIRKASNADPVPVSGLEVTSHMRKLEAAGRKINPFKLFISACEKGLSSVEEYWLASSPDYDIATIRADATCINQRINASIDAVITSPPYHTAVDYYRRHQLEMYWLGFTKNHSERLELLHQYIGRHSVRKNDPRLMRVEDLGALCREWYDRIQSQSPKRAMTFLHYIVSMNDVFFQLSKLVRPSGLVVFVVGNSQWNGSELPTSDLFSEIADPSFTLIEHHHYPLQNKYMSYKRHNEANIRQEFVLAFRKEAL